jgi:hypothetical protein
MQYAKSVRLFERLSLRDHIFCFTLPLVSALYNPVKEFLYVLRLLFLCTQLFYLGAQLAYFDEQQLHFPPHHW